jgi:hypothetical protein
MDSKAVRLLSAGSLEGTVNMVETLRHCGSMTLSSWASQEVEHINSLPRDQSVGALDLNGSSTNTTSFAFPGSGGSCPFNTLPEDRLARATASSAKPLIRIMN